MANLSNTEWKTLKEKLTKDGRTKFVLGEPEQEYVTSRGMDILRLHATDFVNKRLLLPTQKMMDAKPPQRVILSLLPNMPLVATTEMDWSTFYNIPKGEPLTEDQVKMIVDVILRWIEENLDD